jgi:hypothetical protein
MKIKKILLAAVATAALTMPSYAQESAAAKDGERPIVKETTTSETRVTMEPTYDGNGGIGAATAPHASREWTPTEARSWVNHAPPFDTKTAQIGQLIGNIAQQEKTALAGRSLLVASTGGQIYPVTQQYVEDVCKVSDAAGVKYREAMARYHAVVNRKPNPVIDGTDLVEATDHLLLTANQYGSALNECNFLLEQSRSVPMVARR